MAVDVGIPGIIEKIQARTTPGGLIRLEPVYLDADIVIAALEQLQVTSYIADPSTGEAVLLRALVHGLGLVD